jgi:opacity protein-like surface antigen
MRETTLMKLRLNKLAVSFVALSALSIPASAGDWNNGDGSLKESRGRAAVAVPAPMPIPESIGLGWYMRGDVGIGRGNSNEISESGMKYGHNGVNANGSVDQMLGLQTSPFGTSPSWFSNDGKTLLNYGFGIGYHWSKHFRTDVTLDRRNTDQYTGRGSYAYDTRTRTTTNVGGVVTTTDTFKLTNGTTSDDTQLKSGALLLNGYYDVGTRHGFTPYIGAGVGLALLTANRQHGTTEASCAYTPPVLATDPDARSQCPAANYATSLKTGASTSTNMLSLAAMATVGVNYALTQNTSIDMNYRYLFINGQDISATINGHNSKVTLGDIGDHQLRAGLRWDIN